jgi:AraC-like DNA-binding protein
MLLALPHVLRFETGFGPVVEAVALRRSGLVMRRTRFSEMVVDERVLWKAFPLAPRVVRPICYLVFGGRGYLEDGGETLEVEAGDVIAFRAQGGVKPRWHDVRMIEIAWTDEIEGGEARPGAVSDLFFRAKAAPADIASLVAGFDDVWSLDHGAVITRATAFLGDLGLRLPPIDLAPEDAPSEMDLAIARGLSAQFRALSEGPMMVDFKSQLGLSERQLLRVQVAFNEKYRIDAGNWRDLRNRWRVKIAAALLSNLDATVAQIAKAVGYRSPNALARAFAGVGFPPPLALRKQYVEDGAVYPG